MRLDYTAAVVASFWAKIEKTSGCWLWTRGRRNGYGVVANTRGRPLTIYAHILSYVLHKGPIPAGLMVLHTCDVRHCVNPAHLYLGDYSDNIQDAWDRGRRLRHRITVRDSRGRIVVWVRREPGTPRAAARPGGAPRRGSSR